MVAKGRKSWIRGKDTMDLFGAWDSVLIARFARVAARMGRSSCGSFVKGLMDYGDERVVVARS